MLDWNGLIDEYGPMVVRISWRILGHAADVEDNVQDVFLEAFCLQKREEVRHWGGLLRRLATVGALARLRRRRHETSLDLVASGYRQGQFDYLTLLTAQRTYFRVNLAYLESLRQFHTSRVAIEGLLLSGGLQKGGGAE